MVNKMDLVKYFRKNVKDKGLKNACIKANGSVPE